MKASELRAKTAADLNKELNELLKAQFSLRMQLATQQLNNTSEIKKVRRDIARVRTLIGEKAKQS
ncbi:MAG TPA: 50S ribosomal protein L29 [Burkholderiales bacterium]|jgi:large subunit ribosomal protein L29|nr:50S ribosomal protein L29 [Burkholderiales bacterium]